MGRTHLPLANVIFGRVCKQPDIVLDGHPNFKIGRSAINRVGHNDPQVPGLQKTALRHLGIEMKHWTIHDLRRTARTNFSELTEPHVAELMLGHKLPGVWQVYDKHNYIEEQRRAYALWWARVTALVYGEGKVSVLSLSS